MRKNNFFYCIVLWGVLFAGCNFLDEQSQDEVIPKTAQDFGELLLGSGYPSPTKDYLSFLYLLDDDSEANYINIPLLATYPNFQTNFAPYTWQPDMAARINTPASLKNGSAYSELYACINVCNSILDLIDDAIGSAEEKDRVKAEALALRAFHYFYLINIYASPYNVDKNSPGVVLKLEAGVDASPMSRHTVEQVYLQIVDDLKEAIRLFKSYAITRDNYRINLPATSILLSRVYLYMEDWSACISAATQAIEESNGLTDMRGNTAWAPIAIYPFGETEWVYGYTRSNYAELLNYLDFIPSLELLSLYDINNDKRYITFFRNAQRWAGVTSYSGITINKNDYAASNHTYLGHSVRIAEAYLNRAEAYARRQDGKAVDDINALREKRIVGYTPVSAVTIQEVLDERRKELCYEIPRWFDLRRNGMPELIHRWKEGENMPELTFTLKERDPMYTLPIPDDAFIDNGKLIQNESRNSGEREGK